MRIPYKTVIWMLLPLLFVGFGLSSAHAASQKKIKSSAGTTQFEGIVSKIVQVEDEWYLMIDYKVSLIKVPSTVVFSNEDGSKASFGFKSLETMLKRQGSDCKNHDRFENLRVCGERNRTFGFDEAIRIEKTVRRRSENVSNA